MPKTASSSRCQLSAKESLVQVQISDSSAADDRPFVPTVTAIATAPNLEWMVLSTDISSVGSCKGEKTKKTHLSQKKTHTSQKKAHTQQSKQTGTGRLGQSKRKASKEQLSPEEEERRRVRRERNKLAAAKCRNRRRQLTDSLQAETDSLEEEKADLEAEIDNLMKEKEQLSLLLMSHEPHCNMSAELEEKNDQKDKEVMKEKEEEEELVKRGALEDCSPKKSSTIPDTSVSLVSSVNLEKVPTSPVALQQEPIISGDSDVLLCSSAALEPYIDIKDVSMEEMGPKLEYEDDMDLLVPDIDLSSSLGLTEWETLYMTMGENLEPLMFDLEESDSGKVKSGVDNSVLLTL